jgi:hypothetical protein
MGVQMSAQSIDFISMDIHPGMVILDFMAILFLGFLNSPSCID